MDKNNNPFLSPEWLSMQQQYIDALTSLKPDLDASGYQGSNQHAWKEALDYWRQSVEKLLPDNINNKSIFDAIIAQTSGYYAIADQFAALLREISTTDKDSNDWQTVMANHFGKMKAAIDMHNHANAASDNQTAFSWTQPLESWKKAMASMPVLPDELLELLQKGTDGNLFTGFATTPGIGPTREYQEKILTATRLWEKYQENLKEYNLAFGELSKLALDKLETKIIERAHTGKKISSLREFYNLWIEANEQVFAAFAFNEDYSRLYGNLVNSLMAFKHHYDGILDDVLPLLNLPTRQSMQTVYKRQQQVRKQIRRTVDTNEQITRTLHQLNAELQDLRSQIATEKQSTGNKRAGAGKHKKKKA